MRKMVSNLVLTFLTGIVAYYLVARTLTLSAIWVSLAATGIVAMFYLVPYWMKRGRES
ncbi:hypothetical protein HF638_08650 [Paenibacillus sp. SZ31]|uniref:hypothetical protein n=1 Tax=Paenibacillus sp. SZ31 TaxID=2725555 RepID=UPI00146D26A2|nr:hypothetical protein [Paenibacillus sp. SZ31]NMI04046.1 hypothetical protein [Paenibacillus sp. SZ31]